MAASLSTDASALDPIARILAAAETLQRRDREDEAESLLRKALVVKRGSWPVFMKLLELLERTGKLQEAARAYQERLKADPNDPCACFSAGVFFYNKLRRPRQAWTYLRAFAAFPPSRPEWRFNRFLALMNLRRHQEAFAEAERLLDSDLAGVDTGALFHPWLPVHDDAFFRAHLSALSRGEAGGGGGRWRSFYRGCLVKRIFGPGKALRCFAAVSTSPASRYGWMSYASAGARMDLKDYRGAISDLARALRSPFNLWMTRCRLGEARLLLGQRQRGFLGFDRAEAAAEGPGVRGNVLAWRGQMHLKLGDPEESIRCLDQAIGLGARFAYGWRGGALLALGRLDEALADLETAVRLVPQDGEARAWLDEARCLRGLSRPAAGARAAAPGLGRSGAVPRRRRA